MTINKCDKESIKSVVSALKNGGVLVLPTDTVYGFSGIVDINNSLPSFKTDEQIRHIKGRDENKPLIQLIGNPSDIKKYTDVTIPSSLLNKWPGALTIIVPIKKDSPYKNPSLYETVAFRCPGDEWLRTIINELDSPIFSTSVNRSGCPVLDTVSSIKEEFENETSLIIDDGDKKGGVPSTLVSILDGNIKVLRQGIIKIDE